MFYLPADSFNHRGFLHFFYALKALQRIKGRVLDVGCGVGTITRGIKKSRPDLRITACDKEKELLKYFEKHFGKGIKIIYGDVYRLPFDDEVFEAVLMFDVLEHLDKPKKALKEINRILKRGGVFHLSVPCEKSLATWDGWLYKFFKLNLKGVTVGHINLFTPEEIEEVLRAQGFKIVDFYFSQHFLEQFLSLFYYLFVWLFRKGKYLKLEQRNKYLDLGLKAGAWLANLESTFLKKIKGRTLHISCRKK
jgi:ubiquinone/menaquinone biosynthesis C-methylase UbiE